MVYIGYIYVGLASELFQIKTVPTVLRICISAKVVIGPVAELAVQEKKRMITVR